MRPASEAIVLAPSWPGTTGGMDIATRSDVAAYDEFFKQVHLLVLSEKNPPKLMEDEFPRLNSRHIHISKKTLWNRFVRSLLHRSPSITLQYRDLHNQAKSHLLQFRQEMDKTATPVIIIVSIPLNVFIPLVRKLFPRSLVISHSHNVNSRAFAGMPYLGTLASRLAWAYELSRIRRFERWVAAATDAFWTISAHDRKDYRHLLGINADGVLGAYLDTDRFRGLPPGDPETIVHVGRIDLRKGRGISKFIEEAWPIIRQGRPSAKLLLAGSGTEIFDAPDQGIVGMGFVENELEVLKQGMIFINPQIDGSGIQLKSIVAMLSGRLLITSITGSEGIAGRHPLHFFAGNDSGKLAELTLAAIEKPTSARETAQRGQEIARDAYDKQRFLEDAHNLLAKTLGHSG